MSDLSDAEKMRLKRLARLGGPTPAPSTEATGSTPPAAEASTSTPPLRAPSTSRLMSTPTPSATSSPTSQPSPALAPKPKTLKPKPASPAPENKPVIKPAAAPARPKVTYDAWEEAKIGSVFSVTLERAEAESSDYRLCWLKGLAAELRSEGRPVKTSFENKDEILVARLSLDLQSLAVSSDVDQLAVLAGLPEDETVFEYLAGCWKRLYLANREMRGLAYSAEEKARWSTTFDELKRLIISYCGMTLEDPTMFPQPQNRPVGPAEFLPILLAVSPITSTNVDPLTSNSEPVAAPIRGPLGANDLLPFLADLAAGAEDRLAAVITPTMSLFFQEWYRITPTPDILGEDWRRFIGAMDVLVKVKGIAAILPILPVWVAPNVTAPKIEWQSLLGPLSRLSVYPHDAPSVYKTYFSNSTERKVADIDANKANLRQTLDSLQSSLFNIYNAIVRASPEAREGVLEYFALAARLNVKRQGMSVDRRTVASDGFMTNLQVVLLKLFEPVMDVQFSKIDKVEPDYYRVSNRIDISDETKIRAPKEEADSYFADAMKTDAKPNFISDLFFLTNAFQHLGLVKTISNRKKAEKNMNEIEKELKRVEADRANWAGIPAAEAQGEATLNKLKADIATLHAHLHAYDTQLQDPALTRINVTFCGFLMTWLLRFVDPDKAHPKKPISLPLPAEAPAAFRMLPEYLFDNVTEYYDYLSRYDPDALDDADKDILITFAIVFLAPGYVNNPFLKAKLVGILSNGLYAAGHHRKGPLFDRLSVHPMSTEYLMPSLIRFFIDVEATGGHTQFWDKFSFRRDISHIFRSLWSNPLHRESFVKTRHDDFDQFIRFTNMLMSDTTFHLEESLAMLSKINSLRTQQADQAAWDAMPQTERDDIQSQLRQAESSAPFHTHMGRDHIKLIRDFTFTAKEAFLAGEIVDRLAASLDENLANLVGPRMQDLKVSDPDRFSFKPKDLLAAIAQIYLNLGENTEFIRAVANDGRSYSKALFERFVRVLRHRAIMTETEVAMVEAFVGRVEDMRATIEVEDEREVPDDFLVMKDPVILPVSRITIDRSTIRAHLLSTEKDPFNNVPLKYEDCVPDTELKARIDAWIAEGKDGAKMNVDA
ncbi:Ubiquitin conjugation factor E4 [Cryptotrichosporon argae]